MTKFKRLLKIFEETAIAKSWKGGGHPEDIPVIEAKYKKAKTALIDFYKYELITSYNKGIDL